MFFEEKDSHLVLRVRLTPNASSCSFKGIFVDAEERSKGIGRQLLDYAKGVKGSLSLNVYAKNERAMKFYLREGFVIRKKSVDSDTGEQEYKMTTIFP